MKTTVVFMLTTFILFWSGCNENPVTPPQETQVVLRGFLFANQPVQDIQLTSSIGIGDTNTINPPIANANVVLIKNGNRFVLSPNTMQSGYYYYAGNDLAVATGDDFHIEVNYGGQQVTAETVVPPKPEQIALGITTVRFVTDSVQTRNGTRARVVGIDTATVTWNNPAADYFYVVIESIDSARQLLRDSTTFARRFISQPTHDSFYRINNNSILYTGRHKLTVYHVNKEYADLYRSREQDSRTLNEPLTNVRNGLGVFSAFASDSLFFNVTLNN